MIPVAAGVAFALAGVGVAQALVATGCVTAFARRPEHRAAVRPPITILKPLHGTEPMLEAALTTVCQQDYPNWQIVFGVQNESDPAINIVRRLQGRFPSCDIALVIDSRQHGANRKISNLINMLPAARHDVLVIADSDMHVGPDYLTHLMTALQQPGVGLVTTLYAGLPLARKGLASRLGAAQITYSFLPGAALSRALGRQDCLGATMCLSRHDLQRIGGLHALADHLADDNVLGRRIAALGLRVALAKNVPLTTVPEPSLRALFRHELRWARTIRMLEPIAFAASALQYPLAWGLLTILLTGGAAWSIGLFTMTWVLRALAGKGVDHALRPLWREQPDRSALAFTCPVWLLPVRDVLSIVVMLASYGGRHVDWRGHALRADTPPRFAPQQPNALRPIEGTPTR